MSYLKRVLQPDEQVRYVAKIHWVIYIPALAVLAVACAASIASASADATRPLWFILAALLAVLAFLMLAAAWFRRWTTEIAVTSRRVIYKRGFIRRNTIEMNMDKVASVDVVQSIMGRLLNYGSVTVTAAGQNLDAMHTIESPIELRNHITAA